MENTQRNHDATLKTTADAQHARHRLQNMHNVNLLRLSSSQGPHSGKVVRRPSRQDITLACCCRYAQRVLRQEPWSCMPRPGGPFCDNGPRYAYVFIRRCVRRAYLQLGMVLSNGVLIGVRGHWFAIAAVVALFLIVGCASSGIIVILLLLLYGSKGMRMHHEVQSSAH